MAILKKLYSSLLKPASPAILTIAIICLLVLTISMPSAANNRSPDAINSQFGNYLAGRQAQFDANPRSAIGYYLSTLKESPENVFLLRQVVTLLVSEGRIDEALPKAKRLIKHSNNSENIAKLIQLIAKAKDKQYLKAYKNIGGLKKEGLNSFLLPTLNAWLLAGQNKTGAALEIIDTETGNSGLDTLHAIQGALISEFGGNITEAITRYKKIINSQNNLRLRATILLGNLYESLGQKRKAREIYDNYKIRHPETNMLDRMYKRLETEQKPKTNNKTVADGIAEALYNLGSAVQNQAPYQAIIFFRLAVYLRPSFTLAKLILAGLIEDNNNLKDANSIYQNISRDPYYSWAARLKISNNLDRLGNTSEAIQNLRAMALEKTQRIDALIKLGDILQRRKRYQASINAYEQAKKRINNINKKHWTLYFALGISYERIKRWPIAEQNLIKALELSPNHPSILNYLGYSWVEQGLNLDQAQKMIRNAVKQRPRDGYIIDSLGWALYRLGNIEGAVKQLERAVLIRPEDPTINDHLGDIYWSIGRKSEAIFQWNRALVLEPEKEEIPKIKLKLKVGLPKEINKSNGI